MTTHQLIQNGPWWSSSSDSSVNRQLSQQQHKIDLTNIFNQFEKSQQEIPIQKQKISENEHQCPKCQSIEWGADLDAGFYRCYQCGWIGEPWIDSGQEWRVYSSDEHHRAGYDPGRVGSFVHDDFRKSSLSTCIKGTAGSSSIRRIQKYQSMDQKERRLYQSYKLLNNADPSSHQVDHQTCEKAKTIFKSVSDAKQRPSNRKNSMAAAVYLAAKDSEQQVSRKALDEISNMFSVGRKKIQKVSKTSREVLFQKNNESAKKWAPTDPVEEVDRIQHWIGPCDLSWIESAKEIAKMAKENGFGLHTIPTSLAVGCLWWVYQEVAANYNQKQLADAGDCSEATVIRSYQALLESKIFIDSLRKIYPKKEKTSQENNSFRLSNSLLSDVVISSK